MSVITTRREACAWELAEFWDQVEASANIDGHLTRWRVGVVLDLHDMSIRDLTPMWSQLPHLTGFVPEPDNIVMSRRARWRWRVLRPQMWAALEVQRAKLMLGGVSC